MQLHMTSRKGDLFYADVRSENSKILVIFPRNGTRREIYLAGNIKTFL